MNDYSELIKALRCISENVDQRYTECGKHESANCEGCPFSWSIEEIVFSEMSFEERADKVCEIAASALETLTAENARLREYRQANEQETISRLAIENVKLKDTNKALKSDIYNAEMNLEHITAQLAASQRRERAAVGDMKLIVDAVREEHCDETCCFACAFDCDTSINDSGVPNCECPGFERDDCFEWRGPQEAGEGERDV